LSAIRTKRFSSSKIRPVNVELRRVTVFGTQFDDAAWTSRAQRAVWIADTSQNAIYSIRAAFPQGPVFGEGPSGIPVLSFAGTTEPGEIRYLAAQIAADRT
jgi:hypothetical protein